MCMRVMTLRFSHLPCNYHEAIKKEIRKVLMNYRRHTTQSFRFESSSLH